MDNNLVHIKTATGLEIYVDPDAYNDMELLDACYEVQENNNMLALPVVIRHLLTEEARKAMYNHIRAKHGVVRTEPLMQELMDIMGLMAAARRDGPSAAEPAPEQTPAPAPEPEPLFPGDVPPYDRTKQPPAGLVDVIMSRLHGALTDTPAQADKLEKATRAALDVASVESAWELIDTIRHELETHDAAIKAQRAAEKHPGPMAEALLHDVADALRVGPAPAPEPADVTPYGGPAAFKADYVRAGTMPDDAARDAQASATFTPWDELRADPEPADAASSAQQAADDANSTAE